MLKDLEQRYLENAAKIYSKYSTKTTGNEQPLLEFKPDSANNTETRWDSFIAPVGSTRRDITRMSRFLTTGEGKLFLIKQEGLQLSNTFTETRIINPLFILENAVPFIHAERALANPSSFAVRGDTSQVSPASLDTNIQGAGRLQKATAQQVTANVAGSGGARGLLGLLPQGPISSVISGIFSVSDAGSMGANQRPELDVDGQYFSVATWKGFQKGTSPRTALDQAGANLRIGNIGGAINSLISGLDGIINDITNTAQRTGIKIGDIGGRDNPDSTILNGRRYFITSTTDADRYLRNSIQQKSDTVAGQLLDSSIAHLPFSTRNPVIFTDRATVPDVSFGGTSIQSTIQNDGDLSSIFSLDSSNSFGGSFSSFASQLTSAKKTIQQNISGVENTIRSATSKLNISSFSNDINSIFTPQNIAKTLGLSSTGNGNSSGLSENPGEDAMLFDSLSLKKRYEDENRLTFIKSSLDTQKKNQFDYWKSVSLHSDLGFKGDGPKQGEEYSRPFGQRTTNVSGKYLSDTMNSPKFAIIDDEPTATKISANKLDLLKKNGADAIQVTFFDYVNSKIIPFRAFLNGITENVSPVYADTRYIGRIDRNIIYTGVTRELTFSLKVHAFSSGELDGVWSKVNYLTGMCYPSLYDKFGFMVPPLVKLTMGDFYRDQPGYIKSITHTIEDGISWELENGHQVPHGVTIQISYAVLEKTQINTADIFSSLSNKESAVDSSVFYPVGISRSGQSSTTGDDSDNISTIDNTSPIDTMNPGIPGLTNLNIPTITAFG